MSWTNVSNALETFKPLANASRWESPWLELVRRTVKKLENDAKSDLTRPWHWFRWHSVYVAKAPFKLFDLREIIMALILQPAIKIPGYFLFRFFVAHILYFGSAATTSDPLFIPESCIFTNRQPGYWNRIPAPTLSRKKSHHDASPRT